MRVVIVAWNQEIEQSVVWIREPTWIYESKVACIETVDAIQGEGNTQSFYNDEEISEEINHQCSITDNHLVVDQCGTDVEWEVTRIVIHKEILQNDEEEEKGHKK